MNALQHFLSTYPLLSDIAPYLAAAIGLSLLFAVAGASILTFSLQMTGIRTKRSAYDKCAKQVASISLVCGILLLAATRAWIYFSSYGIIVDLAWAVFGFSLVIMTFHYALWRTLSAHKKIHSWLALFPVTGTIVATVCALGALRMVHAAALPNAASMSLEDIFAVALPSPLAGAIAAWLPMLFFMGAALASVWLVLRRKKDDYGRDYYTMMLPWVCRRGFWGALLLTVVEIAITVFALMPAIQSGAAVAPARMIEAALRILPPLLACLLWNMTAKAEIPMRNRPWIYLAFLLSLISGWFIYADATRFVL